MSNTCCHVKVMCGIRFLPQLTVLGILLESSSILVHVAKFQYFSAIYIDNYPIPGNVIDINYIIIMGFENKFHYIYITLIYSEPASQRSITRCNEVILACSESFRDPISSTMICMYTVFCN